MKDYTLKLVIICTVSVSSATNLSVHVPLPRKHHSVNLSCERYTFVIHENQLENTWKKHHHFDDLWRHSSREIRPTLAGERLCTVKFAPQEKLSPDICSYGRNRRKAGVLGPWTGGREENMKNGRLPQIAGELAGLKMARHSNVFPVDLPSLT